MAISRSPNSFPHQIPSTWRSPSPAVADPRGAGGQQTARSRKRERGRAASYSALLNTCGSWRKMSEDSKRRSVGWRNWQRALERLPLLKGRVVREAAIRTSGSRPCRSLVERRDTPRRNVLLFTLKHIKIIESTTPLIFLFVCFCSRCALRPSADRHSCFLS